MAILKVLVLTANDIFSIVLSYMSFGSVLDISLAHAHTEQRCNCEQTFAFLLSVCECRTKSVFLNHQRGLSPAMIVINLVSVQNLFAPICCAFGKDTSRHFSLLGGFGKLNFGHISIKPKKYFQRDSNILASPEAGQGNFLPYV